VSIRWDAPWLPAPANEDLRFRRLSISKHSQGEEFAPTELSRHGTVWSYTDAQYQPPPPYIPATDPYVPFGLAAVELAEGLVVLGQLAEGYGVRDVHVGSEVELVVERLYSDDEGERTIWRWKPVAELGEEADQ